MCHSDARSHHAQLRLTKRGATFRDRMKCIYQTYLCGFGAKMDVRHIRRVSTSPAAGMTDRCHELSFVAVGLALGPMPWRGLTSHHGQHTKRLNECGRTRSQRWRTCTPSRVELVVIVHPMCWFFSIHFSGQKSRSKSDDNTLK